MQGADCLELTVHCTLRKASRVCVEQAEVRYTNEVFMKGLVSDEKHVKGNSEQ